MLFSLLLAVVFVRFQRLDNPLCRMAVAKRLIVGAYLLLQVHFFNMPSTSGIAKSFRWFTMVSGHMGTLKTVSHFLPAKNSSRCSSPESVTIFSHGGQGRHFPNSRRVQPGERSEVYVFFATELRIPCSSNAPDRLSARSSSPWPEEFPTAARRLLCFLPYDRSDSRMYPERVWFRQTISATECF